MLGEHEREGTAELSHGVRVHARAINTVIQF